MGRQLKYASAAGISCVAILGETEVQTGTVTLKWLADGRQQAVPVADAAGLVGGVQGEVRG